MKYIKSERFSRLSKNATSPTTRDDGGVTLYALKSTVIPPSSHVMKDFFKKDLTEYNDCAAIDVRTGVVPNIAINEQLQVMVEPYAIKQGLFMRNLFDVINGSDSDAESEIVVSVINSTDKAIKINKGDKVGVARFALV